MYWYSVFNPTQTSRYGSGYTATIKTNNVGQLITRIDDELTSHRLLEQHHNMVIYSIPQHCKLAPIFAVLSRLRQVNKDLN